MRKIAILLLLICQHSVGQTIYQVNEVEIVAQPSGGVSALNQFISANVQLPIRLAARGMNGRVFVKGVVEPDGSVSGLEIARSLDSSSDREALRIMSLYKAWKPAKIRESPVRQAITYPVIFRTASIPEFDSTDHSINEYFDKNNNPTSDPDKYKFRNSIPVDDLGFVRADILNQELRGGKWKTVHALSFKKEQIWAKISGNKLDSIKAFRISAKMNNWESSFEEAVIQPDGKLLSYVVYPGNGKPPKSSKYYYLNGMLKEEQLDVDEFIRVINWYENGQIGSITEVEEGKGVSVRENWDQDGSQLVKNGNGAAMIPGNAYKGKTVYETGLVVSGNKTGKWTGKLADGTLAYEEIYENGVLKRGRSILEGDVEYDEGSVIAPQFRGGNDIMYQFLGKNIRPSFNTLQGSDGKVVVSFLVNENGRLSDYKIENSVLESLDQEVLRVAKMMDGMWKPGIIKGQKVKQRYTLNVTFGKTVGSSTFP